MTQHHRHEGITKNGELKWHEINVKHHDKFAREAHDREINGLEPITQTTQLTQPKESYKLPTKITIKPSKKVIKKIVQVAQLPKQTEGKPTAAIKMAEMFSEKYLIFKVNDMEIKVPIKKDVRINVE